MKLSCRVGSASRLGKLLFLTRRVRARCLSAILLMMTTPVFALTQGDYTYTVSNGKATIEGFSPAYTGALSITNTLGGYPVTTIGYWAFAGRTGLTSVSIPDGVTSIGYGAFSDCTGLTDITIPVSVWSIGWDAFYGCNGLTDITIPDSVWIIEDGAFYGCDGLTNITIPDSVVSIGVLAFSSCTNLTGIFVSSNNPVYKSSDDGILFTKDQTTLIQCPAGRAGNCTIPACVTSIGYGAFSGCRGLTYVEIGIGVTRIGSEAFSGCTRLHIITVPPGVASIEGGAFRGCSNLTKITVDPNNNFYCSIDGVLFDKHLKTLILCPGGKTGGYTMPYNLFNIGYDAFRECTGLTSVTIPDTVTSISDRAFYGCTGLTSATIPDSVWLIGWGAFYGCTGLASVTIPDGITTIDGEVFSGCTGLTSVSIPNTVTSIGNGAFSGCTGLASVTIPDGVRGIDWNVFSGCTGLTSVTIPDTVSFIGGGAFLECTNLTSITIPSNVIDIGDSAFWGCTSLAAVTIPDNVTRIGLSAFRGCTSLRNIIIPENVASIEGDSFSACDSLTSITVAEDNSAYSSSAGVLFDKSRCTLLKCPGGKAGAYVIPNTVTNIGYFAFYGCSSLSGVTIPDSVTSIEYGAFYGCASLSNLTIPDTVTSLGGAMCEFCTGLTSVKLPSSAATIKEMMFLGCTNLASVAIPDSVTNIQMAAFAYCNSLTSIAIPANVMDIGWWAFSDCCSLSDVYFKGAPPVLDRSDVFDNSTPTVWHFEGYDYGEVFGGRPTECLTANNIADRYGAALTGKTNSMQIVTEHSGDGGVSLQLGGVGLADGDKAGIEWNVTGPGVLTFDWKVSSEADWDVLRCYEVGGSVTNLISGTGAGWVRVRISVTGTPDTVHTFRWEYEKDPFGDCVGLDCGWVDAFNWTPMFDLTVNSGSGDGCYTRGTVVELFADAPPANSKFSRWVGDTNGVADVLAPSTTLMMPVSNVTVTALYVPVLHALDVLDGSGGGIWHEGQTVSVTANPDPPYSEFGSWTGDAAGLLADASARTTSLIMPIRPASLTASYRYVISRVAGCYGRTFTESGTSGGVSVDKTAGSPSGTPVVKLGGAGVVPNGDFAAFETVVSGSGTVTFWWRVSSEINSDYLKFKVDGLQGAAISGTKGSWTQVTNRIEGAGVTHTLRWEYVKNGSLASSADAGWVDDIVWTGDVPQPAITPDIRTTASTDNAFTFTFLGERGIPYTVYSNATLSATGWAPMSIVPQDMGETNGVFSFKSLIDLPAGQKSGFFRITGGGQP